MTDVFEAVPNAPFSIRVPLVIRNVEQCFASVGSSTSGPHVKTSLIPGDPSTELTFALRANRVEYDYSFGVAFHVVVQAKADMKMIRADARLCLQSPPGTSFYWFPWESAEELELEKDQWVGLPDPEEPLASEGFICLTHSAIVDGTLAVYADVLFEPVDFIPPQWAPVLDMSTVVSELRSPVYGDFVLVSTDGQEIRTYKLLLSSVSPVFKAMFVTDCQETREGRCKIDDADAEGIRAMLACIVDDNMSVMGFDLIGKVFKLADKYEIIPLKDKCATLLAKNISMDNVVEAVLLADRHNAPRLKVAGFAFMEENIKQVVISDIGSEIRRADESLFKEWQVYLSQSGNGEGSQKRAADECSCSASKSQRTA